MNSMMDLFICIINDISYLIGLSSNFTTSLLIFIGWFVGVVLTFIYLETLKLIFKPPNIYYVILSFIVPLALIIFINSNTNISSKETKKININSTNNSLNKEYWRETPPTEILIMDKKQD